jgi:hypothetical protein
VATADRAALRDRIADTLAAADGWRWVSDSDKARSSTYRGYQTRADAVLAVLPEPADRAAILREAADVAARLMDERYGPDCSYAIGGEDVARELRRMAGEAQQPETQAADRAAIIDEILPTWEAVYEPGNVSDYLIGYANSEVAAKGAAEAWMRSQAEVTGRLEWVPEERLATGEYDQWFELIERHDDGIDTGPGLIVRRRVADEARAPAGEHR